jgi:hypothetical protein
MHAHTEIVVWSLVVSRLGYPVRKATVVLGSNGQTHQPNHRCMGPDIKGKYSEITSRRTMIQQGTDNNLQRSVEIATSEVNRRMMV